jgi:hypothetical protein
MIIDVHYHLIPSYPESRIDAGSVAPSRAARIMGRPVDFGPLKQKMRET